MPPHLVALLCVWGALAHDHKAGTAHTASHCSNVVTFLPLLLQSEASKAVGVGF